MKNKDFHITYTIIIPHKDIPHLLQRCLDSIPQREDVQVIVVDDNSDPNKVNFAQYPGLGRPETEVYFTKEGKGAGYARNVGLRHAKGKWLLFADADDFYHPDLLRKLDKWKDCESDIVYFDSDSVDCQTLKTVEPRIPYRIGQMQKTEFVNIVWPYPYSKLIRTTLVMNHQLTFEEVLASNDEMFSLFCGYYAGERVDKSDEILYCATVRYSSLAYNITAENALCRLKVYIRCNKLIRKYHMKRIFLDSFGVIRLSRIHGKKAYWQAIRYYITHESFIVLYKDFIRVLKFKVRNFHGK